MRGLHHLALIFMATSLWACEAQAPQSQSEPSTQTTSLEDRGLTASPGPGHLTPENIHANPSIDGVRLKKPALSPNGQMVTVLQGRADAANQQDLWAYDVRTGEGHRLVSSTDLLGAPEELSEEEKNRRERAREYGQGIVDYSWVDDNHLLFPLGGDVYIYDLSAKKARQVTATKGFETDAKVSPNGQYVAYVRDNELYVTDLGTGLERQLTEGATDLIRHATASFVVQEELGRDTGYWWSPTNTYLAYTQIDESPIAIENRLDFGRDGVSHISQRYPFAGTDNARVRLGIVARIGGPTLWVDLGDDADIYLNRVAWGLDGTRLYASVLARNNQSYKILDIDPLSGQSSVLYEETSPTWLNVEMGFHPQRDGSLILTAERSDKRQIFNIMPDGDVRAVTPDTMLVDEVSCIDPVSKSVYFAGWDKSALEKHIFRIQMNGEGLQQLSQGEGWHNASFSGNCSYYIGTFSNLNTPPQTRTFDNQGQALTWLNENKITESHPYKSFWDTHIMPEFGQIEAEDGTLLDYMLYKPKDLKAGERRPVITLVYGGPGVQRVQKSWGGRHMARMLAHHGFVVFRLENRGASNRGKSFEDPIYGAMGGVEVRDQSKGAEWLKSQSFVDPERMGIYGWSYGGYMTLHMLAQTDYYAAGVSGAPVTDWTLYDTAYTERYLGDPNSTSPNYIEGAYEKGSIFAHIDGLTEPFLLIHGMADDNVVFRHSIKLMDEMQKAERQNMRVMTYPGEKHGFRNTGNKVHRDRQILEFFLETLGE